MSQNKASRRRALRSALAHKAAADKFIDSLSELQQKINLALDKLNADAVNVSPALAASATLNLNTDITLTSVAAGAARNGTTFALEVEAPSANPTDTVLVDFVGAADSITCIVRPNDGTNNSGIPVYLTSAELVELINTGAVVGKNVTILDLDSLRVLQTAAGGDSTDLADGGEGDGLVATFSGGANANAGLDTDYVATCSLSSPILADGIYPAQNLSSLRRVWRSKMKHRQLSDLVVESLSELQSKFNAMLAKLDAEAGVLDDGNYVATLSVSQILPDAPSIGQNKASLRKVMVDSMARRRLGNEIVDSLASAQASLNAALANIDAGTINGQMEALKVTVLDPEQP